jgi:DNA-binding NarL/FixJ family response regulator
MSMVASTLDLLFLRQHTFVAGFLAPPFPAGVPTLRVCEERLRTDLPLGELSRAVAIAVVEVTPDAGLAIDACRALHASRPSLPVLALVCCPCALSAAHREALGQVGVSSFAGLSVDRDFLIRAIVQVAGGATIVVDDPVGHMEQAARPSPLSRRERAVLDALWRGDKERAIAREQKVTVSTVKRTIRNLKRKLGATTLFQVGGHAALLGLVSGVPGDDRDPGSTR